MGDFKYLYHGSPNELEGEFLMPRQARSLNGSKDHSHLGIYTSSNIAEALAMIVIKSRGVFGGCTEYVDGKFDALIYAGRPEQEFGFLYVLPTESFKNIPEGSFQWVSHEPVKPARVEKIKVSDYMYLVRNATSEEIRTHKLANKLFYS